jgi:hypothetical protein
MRESFWPFVRLIDFRTEYIEKMNFWKCVSLYAYVYICAYIYAMVCFAWSLNNPRLIGFLL